MLLLLLNAVALCLALATLLVLLVAEILGERVALLVAVASVSVQNRRSRMPLDPLPASPKMTG